VSGTDGGEPGRREVAHRLLAAEFDDATLSYSESDEERAPNYVITPTGARVNRLFAVGVLTEVERVNDDVLRGRVVDPSGAFVTYAGQYQPDPAAFLDRTTPPAFVALTGKARTFEPEDSDVVYTSVRPESINAVDDETRDRWVVSAAESTLERLAVLDAAMESSARGDALRDRLLAAGVRESLAVGVPLAIDHYGTTPAYVEAVRRLAVDALELVAGERDAVRSLDVVPDDQQAVDVGPLPAVDLDLESAAVAPGATETEASSATSETGTTDVTPAEASPTDESAAETAEPAAETAEPAAETAEPAAETTEPAAETTESTAEETAEPAAEETSEPAAETAESTAEETTEPAAETAESTAEETTEPAAETTESADAAGERDSVDDLGDFDAGEDEESAGGGASQDDLGDFDGGDASGAAFDEDEMYELDESERAELEAEFDTGFTSGNEVDAPGEADIDVPDPADEGTDAADAADAPAADESGDGSGGAAADAEADEPAGSATETADESESAAADEAVEDSDRTAQDVDLEAAVVESMAELDDGDGASREDVVADVVDEYGVAPEAVRDAIQSALMSGRCYEPSEDSLKAI
jgi:hypothetical protein